MDVDNHNWFGDARHIDPRYENALCCKAVVARTCAFGKGVALDPDDRVVRKNRKSAVDQAATFLTFDPLRTLRERLPQWLRFIGPGNLRAGDHESIAGGLAERSCSIAEGFLQQNNAWLGAAGPHCSKTLSDGGNGFFAARGDWPRQALDVVRHDRDPGWCRPSGAVGLVNVIAGCRYGRSTQKSRCREYTKSSETDHRSCVLGSSWKQDAILCRFPHVPLHVRFCAVRGV